MWYDPKLHFDWASEILGGFEDESTWSIAFYFYRYFLRICIYRHRLSPTAHQISSHGKMGGRFYQNSVYPCHNYQLDLFANQLRIGKIPGLLEAIEKAPTPVGIEAFTCYKILLPIFHTSPRRWQLPFRVNRPKSSVIRFHD